MRFAASNKTGTANLRQRSRRRDSAPSPRLIPGGEGAARTYNDPRTTPCGAGNQAAVPEENGPRGRGVIVSLAEYRSQHDAPGQASAAVAPLPTPRARHGGRVGGRALVIERDEDYADLTAALLRRDGWEVELEQDGSAALQRLSGDGFNVVFVATSQFTLESGRSLLAEIRGASDAPVIALSKQEDQDEIVEQLLQGADYDLVKPFSPRRFRAAVRAVTRRGRAGAETPPLSSEVRVGDVTMSFGRLEVVAGDRRVELSPREFALLHLLLAHPGTVFTREELARLAWGWRGNTDSRAVDNAVRRLRRKIELNPRQPRYILTERGAGYSFAPL